MALFFLAHGVVGALARAKQAVVVDKVDVMVVVVCQSIKVESIFGRILQINVHE